VSAWRGRGSAARGRRGEAGLQEENLALIPCRKVDEVWENHRTPIECVCLCVGGGVPGGAFIYIESCTCTIRTVR
jgi:hypothetical protein